MSLISGVEGGRGRGDSGITGQQVHCWVGVGLRRSGLLSIGCIARIIGLLALVGHTGLRHCGCVAATGIGVTLASLVAGFGLRPIGFPRVLPVAVSPGCLLTLGERLPRVPRFPGS